MITPRFTIRTGLIGVAVCALLFLVVGVAMRGGTWAWGITIGLASLIVTMLVHAAWFGLVWWVARLPAAQPVIPAQVRAAGTTVLPHESSVGMSEN